MVKNQASPNGCWCGTPFPTGMVSVPNGIPFTTAHDRKFGCVLFERTLFRVTLKETHQFGGPLCSHRIAASDRGALTFSFNTLEDFACIPQEAEQNSVPTEPRLCPLK